MTHTGGSAQGLESSAGGPPAACYGLAWVPASAHRGCRDRSRDAVRLRMLGGAGAGSLRGEYKRTRLDVDR